VAPKRNTRTKKQKNSLPWGPMFLSFAVGAFVMFLLHLKDNVQPTQISEKSHKVKKEKKTHVEPKFEFYTLLPETEVVVDEPDTSKKIIVTAPVQPGNKKESKVKKVKYMLQVGSFRKASDADAHKAKLAFLGIESTIQTVTVDGKETWHRVQVGPIIGRDKVDALKKKLQKNGIDSLLVRAKNG